MYNNAIVMRTYTPAEKLPVGSSKLLGNPDVWPDFEWPYIVEGGEEYDLSFVCQINCAEVAPYDKDNRLPHTGMLYFFYDADAMPSSPAEDGVRVIYYDGDLSDLHEMIVVDDNDEEVAFAEQAIEFSCADESKEPVLFEGEPTHKLLGTRSLDYYEPDEMIKDFSLLLQLDSFETDDCVVNFVNEGMLYFYIEEDALRCCDFSNVKLWMMYS